MRPDEERCCHSNNQHDQNYNNDHRHHSYGKRINFRLVPNHITTAVKKVKQSTANLISGRYFRTILLITFCLESNHGFINRGSFLDSEISSGRGKQAGSHAKWVIKCTILWCQKLRTYRFNSTCALRNTRGQGEYRFSRSFILWETNLL